MTDVRLIKTPLWRHENILHRHVFGNGAKVDALEASAEKLPALAKAYSLLVSRENLCDTYGEASANIALMGKRGSGKSKLTTETFSHFLNMEEVVFDKDKQFEAQDQDGLWFRRVDMKRIERPLGQHGLSSQIGNLRPLHEVQEVFNKLSGQAGINVFEHADIIDGKFQSAVRITDGYEDPNLRTYDFYTEPRLAESRGYQEFQEMTSSLNIFEYRRVNAR